MGRQYGHERFLEGEFADDLHCCIIITVIYEFFMIACQVTEGCDKT